MNGLRIFFYTMCAITVSVLAFVVYLLATHSGSGYIAWNCANLVASAGVTVRVYDSAFPV